MIGYERYYADGKDQMKEFIDRKVSEGGCWQFEIETADKGNGFYITADPVVHEWTQWDGNVWIPDGNEAVVEGWENVEQRD